MFSQLTIASNFQIEPKIYFEKLIYVNSVNDTCTSIVCDHGYEKDHIKYNIQ